MTHAYPVNTPCNGLWCWGTTEPKSSCDNGDSNTKITDCKVLE